MIKNIVFDLDGTILDTESFIIDGINYSLRNMDLPEKGEDEIREKIGLQSDAFYNELLYEYEEDEVKDIKKEIYSHKDRFIKEQGKLYDKMEDVIKSLHEKGYKLSICSHGKIDYIETILEHFHLKKYFSSVKGYEKDKTKEDHLKEIMKDENADRLVFVGDRYIDFEAAKNTGNISIGVTHGFGKEELIKADYVVDNPCEILQIIEKLNSKSNEEM